MYPYYKVFKNVIFKKNVYKSCYYNITVWLNDFLFANTVFSPQSFSQVSLACKTHNMQTLKTVHKTVANMQEYSKLSGQPAVLLLLIHKVAS